MQVVYVYGLLNYVASIYILIVGTYVMCSLIYVCT